MRFARVFSTGDIDASVRMIPRAWSHESIQPTAINDEHILTACFVAVYRMIGAAGKYLSASELPNRSFVHTYEAAEPTITSDPPRTGFFLK